MSVQSINDGYNPVNLGVKLPDGTTYWLSPKSRKALRAEVDTLARKLKVDAKALRHKLFAVIKEKGMEFPSDRNTQEAVKTKAERKQRRLEAMDVALFINSLQGVDTLDDYNLALASFMEENNEGTAATAKTIQVASEESGEYPVMSYDLADFAEMRKHGGRYTKAINQSRTDRRKLLSESLEVKLSDGSTHSVAPRGTRRRARKAQRVNRRLKSYLERLSRGLISPKPRAQSRALSMSTMSTYYRRARRMASKAYKVVMAKVDDMLDHCEMPAKAVRSTQYLVGFDWVGFKVSIDRFEDLLSSLLVRYFKERKEALKPLPDTEASDRRKRRKRIPVIQEQCTIQAQLAWGKGSWNRVTQKLSINLGSLVAKACK